MLIECILLSSSLCRATRDKPVMELGLSQAAVLVADGVTTREQVRLGYTEADPLARSILGSRPTWARMAPLGALQCLLETYLAERMRRSPHRWIRGLWWLPQSVGIGGNIWGVETNTRNARASP
jgi:hypothetical protein